MYTREAGLVEFCQEIAYQVLREHQPGRFESFNGLHEGSGLKSRRKYRLISSLQREHESQYQKSHTAELIIAEYGLSASLPKVIVL